MNYTIIDCEQRTEGWYAARAGRITASCASDVLAFNRDGKEAAKRRDYRTQIVLERVFSRPMDGDTFQNEDMKRGVRLEPEAVAVYESTKALMVRRLGFVVHNELPIGVSPDGDLDDLTGLLEVKAPRPATHWAYRQAGVVPSDYIPQLVHGQLVTGAEWTDFVSFCPDFGPLALFVVRYERDEKAIATYRLALERFLSEVAAEESAVREALGASLVAA